MIIKLSALALVAIASTNAALATPTPAGTGGAASGSIPQHAVEPRAYGPLEERGHLEERASLTSVKKGLGYNTASYLTQFEKRNTLAWAYNWANSVTWGGQNALPAPVDFVPMLWGSDATGWSTAAKKRISQGGKYLLGFNEPDLSSQSNITPAEAARLWKLNMEPFASTAKLVSPAVTNGAWSSTGAPMGVNWMSDFLGNCTGCHISAIALHWYDAAWNTGYFVNYLTDAHNKFNKPIWLTEFAGSGTTTEQRAFLKKVIPWMEKTTWIQRYAGFGAFEGMYVYQNGSLTPIGDMYMRTV